MSKVRRHNVNKSQRHDPLDKDILDGRYAKQSMRMKKRNRREATDDKIVDHKSTKKILNQARKQQEDLEEEIGLTRTHKKLDIDKLLEGNWEEDSEDNVSLAGSEFMEEIKIDPEDEKALENFMCKDPVKRATLADFIKDKLTEKQTELNSICSDVGGMRPEDIEKLTPIYKGVAQVLSRYRSGKVPKAFKVIPKFSNWEEVLYMTEPDNWSAAAMYQATRIFTSNLKEKMAQRFYNLVLLPRLRDDIAESKCLNFHLYQALKKALFKPSAFFKGIVLPLCESGSCTLREATIFGSILAKCSVPILHSSAALLRITEMEYSAASSIFMRVLIEKKYALPYRVTDGIVAHYARFENEKRALPLLWHQCLLTFVQIYSNDLTSDQKTTLLKLISIQSHRAISPEVRKCIENSTTRSLPVIDPE